MLGCCTEANWILEKKWQLCCQVGGTSILPANQPGSAVTTQNVSWNMLAEVFLCLRVLGIPSSSDSAYPIQPLPAELRKGSKGNLRNTG
jgi:hypothetical protein